MGPGFKSQHPHCLFLCRLASCLMSDQPKACRLCGRVTPLGTTEHHLIPRTCHSNKWFKKNFSREQMLQTVSLCRDCHSAVHRFVPREKDLGRRFYTVELLLQHEQIGRLVQWLQRRHENDQRQNGQQENDRA